MKKFSSFRSGSNPLFKNLLNPGGLCRRLSFLDSRFCPWGLLNKLVVAAAVCLLSISNVLNAESIIKFKEINGCLIVVPLRIDGKGPYNFIIDTGSDDTAIDLDLVMELGVSPTSSVTLVTTAGSQEVPSGYPLRNVQLGSRVVPEVKALAMNLAALKPYKIRGIVGQSLLSQFSYFLDYKRHEMTIEENSELGGRLVGNSRILSFQKSEGRWMVRVPRETGAALKMVLDAGANELVMYDCEKLGLDIDNGSLHTVQVATNVGTRELRAARLRHFDVGGVALRNLTVVLAKNGTGDEARPEDGLLPAKLFNTVYFNSARMQVVLNPEFSSTVQISGK